MFNVQFSLLMGHIGHPPAFLFEMNIEQCAMNLEQSPRSQLLPVKPFRLLSSLLCVLCAAASASAFLGDTVDDIAKHRGKPAGKPDRHKALWLFEGNDGQLAYAVRFDDAGKSIAEVLKPALIGRTLHPDIVGDFIKAQIERVKDSPTLLTPKIGEKYMFAGREFVVADNEFVTLDAPHGILVVWVKGSVPSVTVIAPAALQ